MRHDQRNTFRRERARRAERAPASRRSSAGRSRRPAPSRETSCARADRDSRRERIVSAVVDRADAPRRRRRARRARREQHAIAAARAAGKQRNARRRCRPSSACPSFPDASAARLRTRAGEIASGSERGSTSTAPRGDEPTTEQIRRQRVIAALTRASSGFAPVAAPLQHDDRRLLVAVAVRIIEQRALDVRACTPCEAPSTFALPRSLASTTAHSTPQRSRNAARERVGLARREHDRALVRRHRAGVSVDGGDRFAHQFVEDAAPSEQPRRADAPPSPQHVPRADALDHQLHRFGLIDRRQRAGKRQSTYASFDGRTCSATTNSPCAIATAVSETATTSPARAMPRTASATTPARSSPGRTKRVRTGIAVTPAGTSGRVTASLRVASAHGCSSSTISSRRYLREPFNKHDVLGRCVRAQPGRGFAIVVDRDDLRCEESPRAARRARARSAKSPPTSSTSTAARCVLADALVQRLRFVAELRHAAEHGDPPRRRLRCANASSAAIMPLALALYAS